jgi:hypothetical protein
VDEHGYTVSMALRWLIEPICELAPVTRLKPLYARKIAAID